jgi:hypothetical protein
VFTVKVRLISVLCVSVLLLTLLCSCGAPAEDVSSPDEVVSEPEPVYTSALTGLPVESEEASNRRPVAIMINNINDKIKTSKFE